MTTRTRRKSQSGRKKPRARRRVDDDVIDVEAEPVTDAPPRPEPAPIVVRVRAEQPQKPAGGESGNSRELEVNGVSVRAIIRDVREAAEVGKSLGELFVAVFGRR